MDYADIDDALDRAVRDKEADHNNDEKKANIIQVTNVSHDADLEHMQTLFGYLGEIAKIQLYDFDLKPETNSKVCFVEFVNPESVTMARHLTNTTFIDRALVVTTCNKPEIPDKETAQAELMTLILSDTVGKASTLKSYSSRSNEHNKDRERHRDRERSERHHSRRTPPRDLRSYRSSKSRDRDLPTRYRSRSPTSDRNSRRAGSRDRSTRRRSRSRESRRKRSRSREESRSSRHHKSSRR